MIGVEVLSTLSINVHSVSVVSVAAVADVGVVVRGGGSVVGGVLAIATVISGVVVAAVPCRVPVIRSAVIHDCRAVPAAVPTAITPAAASAAHHRSNGYASA